VNDLVSEKNSNLSLIFSSSSHLSSHQLKDDDDHEMIDGERWVNEMVEISQLGLAKLMSRKKKGDDILCNI